MARSDAYDLLPGSTPSTSIPLTKKASLFVRRKPVLSSLLSLLLLTTVYISIFPSHPQALSNSVSSSWNSPSRLEDDESSWYPAAKSQASDRERCDQVWRDEGRVWPPAAVPALAGSEHGGGAGAGEAHGNGGWGTEAEGREGFSLEEEMKKGKTRKEVLQEMVGKTKGYYVRDWPL